MNSLFIGLGGSGAKAVALLNKMLLQHSNILKADENKVELFGELINAGDEFLYVDTDNSILNEYKDVINDNDFFNLGKLAPNSILQESKRADFKDKEIQKRLLEWVDEGKIAVSGAKSLEVGADGLRMLSRLVLYQECISKNQDSLKNTLEQKLLKVQQNQTVFNNSHANAQLKPRIYIISGSCGGTGSGILLDIMYLIHCAYKTLANLQDLDQPLVRPVIIMPHGYIEGLPEVAKKTNYKLNAYAFFQELNAAIKNRYDTNFTKSAFNDFSLVPINVQNDIVNKFNPFQLAFCYDSASKDSSNYEGTAKKLANFIYQLEVASTDLDSNFTSTVDSSLTNDIIPEINNSVYNQYVNAFVVPGYYSLVKSDEFLKAYCKLRLKHEIIQYGIKGPDIKKLSVDETVYFVDNYESYLKAKIVEFKNSFASKLESICGNTRKDVLQFSEDLSLIVHKQFMNKVIQENGKPLLDIFTDQIATDTFALIPKYFKEFSLKVAYEAFYKLENHIKSNNPEEKLNKKTDIENRIKKEIHFSEKDCADYKRDLIDNFFDYYLQKHLVLVLTKGDEGVLDDCCRLLKNFFDQSVYTNRWETEFKELVRIAKNDKSKQFIPDLKSLVNQSSEIVKDNFCEKKYKQILIRDKVSPDLPLVNEIFSDENDKPVVDSYSIAGIKRIILSEIENLDAYFNPVDNHINFAIVQEEIVNRLNEWIEKEMGKSPIIKTITDIPIDKMLNNLTQAGISGAEYKQIVNNFCNNKNVEIQLRNKVVNKQEFTVIFGNFSNNLSLQQDLKAIVNAGNQMRLKVVQDNVETDRIVKLRLEIGYNINDYFFYENEYEPFFKSYFKEKGSKYGHQPFIDKRFMGDNFEGDVWKVFVNQMEKKELNVEAASKHDDSDIVKFLLFYLLEMFNQLVKQGKISDEIKTGILYDDKTGSFNIKACEYSKWGKKFILSKSNSSLSIMVKNPLPPNDLPTYNSTLLPWINLLSSLKSEIANEFTIFKDALEKMESAGLIANLEFLELFADPDTETVSKDIMKFYMTKFKL